MVQSSYSRASEKWSNYRYVLKVELTNFADGLAGVIEKEEPMITPKFGAPASGRTELSGKGEEHVEAGILGA